MDILSNLNTWLVALAVGAVVWTIRQIIPDTVEGKRPWKLILRILPLVLGVGMAMIPGLRPVADNLAQSGAIGFIGGSFAMTAYEVVREAVPGRLKSMMGSKARRVRESQIPPEPEEE